MLKSNGLRHSKNPPVRFSFSPKTVPVNIAKKLPPQRCSKPIFIALFNFSHKWTTFAFTSESGYTLGSAQRIAHKGLHGETGAFQMGGAITTLGAFRRFTNIPGPGIRTANFAAFGSWSGGALEERRKPSGQRCAYACRCPEGVAAPLGCVIFSLLSKLRPVRPIPETSFSSPDAPACAVPVQATSQLVSFRLEADRGFSVLSLCLTSFFDFGDKKRPPTLCAHGAGQRSDFQYSGC